MVLLGVTAVVIAIAAWAGGRSTDDRAESPVATAGVGGRVTVRPGRVSGFVRDTNGAPVAGARVRVAGTGGRGVRTSRTGRFELPAPAGRRTLVADGASYTRQSVTTTVARGRGARVDFALALTDPDRVAVANSADRVIVWTGCDQVAALSEEALARWMESGVDGFVCQTGFLHRLGGANAYTGRRAPRGAQYRFQRGLARSPAGRRAAEGKLLLYLGFYASSYVNRRTPLAEWFDDRTWSRVVLPEVRDLAAAARALGFTGLALDQELYPQRGGTQTATWEWRYRGGRHGEAAVRAKVAQRGRQLMESMVRGYPGVELVAYDTRIPASWDARVQVEVNDARDPYEDEVRLDLWNGLTATPGYSAIRWMDATFYKTPHLNGASWGSALEYNANSLYSFLSRRFANWNYASSRLHISPFAWVDQGPAPFERARDPGYVAEQLKAFREWGIGGSFANYAYEKLSDFDYGPYLPGLRAASMPARVDGSTPRLALRSKPRRLVGGRRVTLRGVASDNFAIRAVRWYDDRGRQGVARLTWHYMGSQRGGWRGQMRWSIPNLRVQRDAGHITISAEDVKGLAREVSLRVAR